MSAVAYTVVSRRVVEDASDDYDTAFNYDYPSYSVPVIDGDEALAREEIDAWLTARRHSDRRGGDNREYIILELTRVA